MGESCESDECGESADSEAFGDTVESDHSGNSVESGDHGKGRVRTPKRMNFRKIILRILRQKCVCLL